MAVRVFILVRFGRLYGKTCTQVYQIIRSFGKLTFGRRTAIGRNNAQRTNVILLQKKGWVTVENTAVGEKKAAVSGFFGGCLTKNYANAMLTFNLLSVLKLYSRSAAL